MATDHTPNLDVARHARGELRHIPLSRIAVREGLNPRGAVVEDEELQALAQTMRERGCLQPVRVRAAASGEYLLIAGERRYRAALLAGLTEIPASVQPADVDQELDEAELASEALIENELRCDLNPVQRANGYQRLLSLGLSVRGVAERLGGKTRRASRERRIREHLAVLALPEDLRELVAGGQIPLLAVKTLVGLCEIHEDLARRAAAAVLEVEQDAEPFSWQEVIDAGLEIAVRCSETLPPGIFQSYRWYPLESFTLSEKASRDLAALQKLNEGRALGEVCFGAELVDAVRPLGTVHDIGSWSALVVGQEIGDRLAEDYIAARLKDARAQARRWREQEREAGQEPSAADAPAGGPESEETFAQREQRIAEQARDRRAQEREQRDAAIQFDQQLGVLAYKHLARVKVDERVLRILASVNLAGELDGIAARGARLALPGWASQQKRGARLEVLERYEAERKACAFLEGAQSAAEIAGRALSLIALAALADEDAIARSNRCGYELRFQGPWRTQARRDLHAIVRERIKEGQLADLDRLLAERIAADEQQLREETEMQQAAARLEGVLDRLEQMDAAELAQALCDAELAWGRFDSRTHSVRKQQQRVSGEQKAERPVHELAAA
jgi:ParB/RepB/Spo0J family partition protein